MSDFPKLQPFMPAGYPSMSEYWRARSIEMHRRAQKAEGELSRVKEAITTANRYALSKSSCDRYYMLGWMVSHIKPIMHLTFQKPFAPTPAVEPNLVAVPRDRLLKPIEYSDAEYVPNSLFSEFRTYLDNPAPVSREERDA